MSHVEIKLANSLNTLAEKNRREPASFATMPQPLPGQPVDYGACMAAITTGAAHMAEALPNGQRQRAVQSFAALVLATEELRYWMRVNGWFDMPEEDESGN